MQGPAPFIPEGMSHATRMTLQPAQALTSKKTTDSDGSCGQNITDDHSLLPNPQQVWWVFKSLCYSILGQNVPGALNVV